MKRQSNTERTDSARTLYMRGTPTVKEINHLSTYRSGNLKSK